MTREDREMFERCIDRIERVEMFQRKHAEYMVHLSELLSGLAEERPPNKEREREALPAGRHLRLVREE